MDARLHLEAGTVVDAVEYRAVVTCRCGARAVGYGSTPDIAEANAYRTFESHLVVPAVKL